MAVIANEVIRNHISWFLKDVNNILSNNRLKHRFVADDDISVERIVISSQEFLESSDIEISVDIIFHFDIHINLFDANEYLYLDLLDKTDSELNNRGYNIDWDGIDLTLKIKL